MRRASMAWLVCLLGAAPAVAHAGGSDDLRRAQINAARAGALAAVQKDVLSAPVARDLTVGQLADAAGGRDQLLARLHDVEQVGGTRWLDDKTCEVRLDIQGDQVAAALLPAADAKGVGAPPRVVKAGLDQLRRRTFSGSGMSTLAAENLRPAAGQLGWRTVTDEQVKQAVEAARRDAADRLLESVATITYADGKTLGDAMKNPAVHDALHHWALDRPITLADFRDNREVRLTIYAPPEDFVHVMHEALGGHPELALADSEIDKLTVQVARRVQPTVGQAMASGGSGDVAMALPRELPTWTGEQFDARGSAPFGRDDRLRAAARAEAAALTNLRKQVDALPLSDDLKLGAAARRDPLIDRAVDRGVRCARVYKVRYETSAVEVVMSLNLQDLWRELEDAQFNADAGR